MNSRSDSTNIRPVDRRSRAILFALLASMLTATALAQTTPDEQTPDAETTGTRLPPGDLITHSSGDRYWIAQIMPRPSTPAVGPRPSTAPRTAVRSRHTATGRGWQRVIVVHARVIDLAHRGDNAALLLEDGSWLLAWPGGSITGPELPGGVRVAALGADELSLWAVGTPGETGAPATGEPAPSPTPDVGEPTSGMFWLSEAGWKKRVALPAGIDAASAMSVAVMGGRPVLAWLDSPRRIAIVRLDGEDRWEDTEFVTVSFDVRQFELLHQTPQPTLWVAGPSGAGQLHVRRGGKWGEAVPLAAVEAAASREAALARSVEFFAGSVRFTWWDGRTLREQSFSLDGQAVGEAIDLGRTPPAGQQPVGPGTLVLLGVLGALLAMNIFRGEEEQELDLGGRAARLAPLPRRLVAGLIDLLPVPAVALWQLLPAMSGDGESGDVGLIIQTDAFALWMVGAGGFYLLHTTIGEMIGGRTIGKLACRLRTAVLDGGGPPRPAAVLLRNVFRVIDLVPILPMALLILFSPLRQRLGDVIAGTVVVTDRDPFEPESPDEADRETAGEDERQDATEDRR